MFIKMVSQVMPMWRQTLFMELFSKLLAELLGTLTVEHWLQKNYYIYNLRIKLFYNIIKKELFNKYKILKKIYEYKKNI